MSILVLSGSRDRKGQTARAITALRKGITAAGGSSETLFLPEFQIERCRQCDNDGWGLCRRDGRCVIEDDFDSILAKMKLAEVMVFANPVYFGDLSESMQAFLDRLRRINFPKLMKSGGPGMPPRTGDKPVIGLCYAGGSGNGTTSCCAALERILQTCGFDVVDMIPARRQNLDAKLPVLELTGRWLVTKPTSGPPFVPPERR